MFVNRQQVSSPSTAARTIVETVKPDQNSEYRGLDADSEQDFAVDGPHCQTFWHHARSHGFYGDHLKCPSTGQARTDCDSIA